MKKLLVLLLLAFTISVRAQTPSQQQPAGDETTAGITALHDGLIESFNKGDIDKLVTFLAPDAVITWQSGEVSVGPAEVKAYYQRMMTGDTKVVREIHSLPEVTGRHIYGDWGVSWGKMHDHFIMADGRDLPMNSSFTAAIAKRGDRWVVTAFHLSINAFESPVTTFIVQRIGIWVGFFGLAGGLVFGFIAARMWAGRGSKTAPGA